MFDQAWAESLKMFHTDKQKRNMMEIFWRNLSKLFRGRVNFLPIVDVDEHDRMSQEIVELMKINDDDTNVAERIDL